jgi:hypothetical protein
MMRLAVGLGLAASISAAGSITNSFGTDWQVSSERVGGEGQSSCNQAQSWRYHYHKCLRQYKEYSTLTTIKRKQEQEHKGH